MWRSFTLTTSSIGIGFICLINPFFLHFPILSEQDSLVISADTSGVELLIPTFLGNDQRHYYGNQAPEGLEVIWKHWLGEGETTISRNLGSRKWKGAGWTGQPLMVREGAELYLIQGAYDHHLKKIRAKDGTLVWEYAFDDVVKGTGTIWRNPDADKEHESVIIFQGSRLGLGEYLDTKHVPSFRAISYYTGEELWRLDSKWTHSYSRDVDGSALMVDDTLYIGLENSLFTVIDPDPRNARIKDGMKQPPIIQERRLYRTSDVDRHQYNVVTESSPSLLDGRIYIASGSGRVWGYDLEQKALLWEHYIGSDMDGSAIVTSDSTLLVSVEKQYIRGNGGVMKLDPTKTGDEAVVWYFPVSDFEFVSWEGGVIGSVGINDFYVKERSNRLAAFTGVDGWLHVVSHQKIIPDSTVLGPDSLTRYATPKQVFQHYIGPSISTPIFTDDKLIAASYEGISLFAYDSLQNFRLIDRFQGPFEATPIVWNGKLYLASRNGYLYCLGRMK